jgi:predicted Zn-dependent protease
LAISLEEERAMGDKILAQILSSGLVVEDEFVNKYISGLGQYLTRGLETKHFPYDFHVIRDSSWNAFATPGGHIFMFTGLIEIMEDVEELAGVLCHEIAHVSARHISQRIEQSKKLSWATMAGMLAGLVLGGAAGGALMQGSMAAGQAAQLAYSREHERQADQMGFEYMRRSSYNPAGMAATFIKMQRSPMLDPDAIPPYLLTHPMGPERIANIEMMARNTPVPTMMSAEAAVYKKYFKHVKTILRAKYYDPDVAEKIFNSELKSGSDPSLSHFGLGVVAKRRGEYTLAIKHFEVALKRNPRSKNILTHLGETYQLQGEDSKAISCFRKVLNVDKYDKQALFLMAMSYQNLGQYPRAIPLYEKLSTMKPVKAEVYYNLGVCYGRQKKLGLAHFNFGIYFIQVRNPKKSQFHFNKARSLAGNDQRLIQRIDEMLEKLSTGSNPRGERKSG